MSIYAAYAGNLDARLMSRRAPHSPLRGTGWLDGWRLTFGGEQMGWEGALATLVEVVRLCIVTELERQASRWRIVHVDGLLASPVTRIDRFTTSERTDRRR